MIVVVLWKQISAFELCFMSGGVKVRLKPMDVAWLPHLPPQKSKIWGSSYLLAHKGNGTDFSHSHIQKGDPPWRPNHGMKWHHREGDAVY
jgi:hypothetical protein